MDATIARSIRLVGLDVDGVLTDGGIYLGAVDGRPMEFKRYEIQDGLGIYLMKRAGIRVAIVTGRVSDSVRLRAAELGVDDVAQDPNAQQLPALLAMLDRHGIDLSEAAFIGDDFPDMAVLHRFVLPFSVGRAVPEGRVSSAPQLEWRGGQGAIREFAERLLKARGEWESVTEQYVAERSIVPAESHA